MPPTTSSVCAACKLGNEAVHVRMAEDDGVRKALLSRKCRITRIAIPRDDDGQWRQGIIAICLYSSALKGSRCFWWHQSHTPLVC